MGLDELVRMMHVGTMNHVALKIDHQTTDSLHLDPPMRYARLPKRSPVLKKHHGESQLNQTEEPWPSYNVRQHTTQGRSASVAFGH